MRAFAGRLLAAIIACLAAAPRVPAQQAGATASADAPVVAPAAAVAKGEQPSGNQPPTVAPARAANAAQDDTLTIGGRVVPAGTSIRGPVVVAGGDLDIRGTVEGSAIAIAGDVIVRSGGRVTGDAIAAFGDVRSAGGSVDGAMRSMTGTWGRNLRSSMRGEDAVPARSALSLAVAWFGVMILIGLGVLVFASSYLDGVVDVLEESFWRSFLVGIAGEVGVLPALVLLIIALAITIIGALLIPFAIVAFVLAVAGLATLGFIAVARLTGEGVATRAARRLSQRGGALRAVLVGVSIYMGVWVIATALGGVPAAGAALRIAALVVTYVAITAGFGAAILSRAGTRRDAALAHAPAPAMDAASWATPTPVTGVVAARRPTAPKADVGAAR